MFADEIAAGNLIMPYANIAADGFGYYLKTHAEDLSDPKIFLLRDQIISHFSRGTLTTDEDVQQMAPGG